MTDCNYTKSRAKHLRKNLTDVERALWSHLRARQMNGFKFRRQAPIGTYIADFVCYEKRLVVEVDRGQHTTEKDAVRDVWFRGQRLSGLEILGQ